MSLSISTKTRLAIYGFPLRKASKTDLRDYADGRIRKITSVSYGVRDGMKTRAFNVGNQPTAWRTAEGLLLFSSMKGVVIVDPGRLVPGNYVPPVYVESVSINRQKLPLNPEPRPPQGAGEAEIDYTALSYADPEKLRFRYMLEGVDTDWVDAGNRQFAYYANLPPGNFRFRVIAGNADGPWNRKGAVFAFYLIPHFYQTRPFWAALASGMLLLGWALYRVHMLGGQSALLGGARGTHPVVSGYSRHIRSKPGRDRAAPGFHDHATGGDSARAEGKHRRGL